MFHSTARVRREVRCRLAQACVVASYDAEKQSIVLVCCFSQGVSTKVDCHGIKQVHLRPAQFSAVGLGLQGA